MAVCIASGFDFHGKDSLANQKFDMSDCFHLSSPRDITNSDRASYAQEAFASRIETALKYHPFIMRSHSLFGALCVVLLLTACGGPRGISVPESSPVILLPTRENGEDWRMDDLARFYAGLPTAESGLRDIEALPVWRQHAMEFDRDWRGVTGGPRHPRARQWAASDLRAKIPPTPVIYYLFGGADFLTVDLLFPDAREIYLVGLEPVGELPSPEGMSEETLGFALANLRYSFYGLFDRGFSETKDLRANLARTPLKGVKPLLFVTLARTGSQVLSAREFTIGAGRAIEIPFRRMGERMQRKLVYIQGDLSNSGDSRLLDYIGQHRPAGAYLKAASYLLHEEAFSRTRRFLLSSTQFILQDDSGIPLRAFDPSVWNLYFYGNYLGVMPIFEKYFQKDLYEIYRTPGAATPLMFGLGYRIRDDEACQILAVKRF